VRPGSPEREGEVTNDEKKRVITDYLEASARRDFERMAAFLTEDFTLWMVLSARERGMPSPLAGREAFFDFARKLRERPDMWKVRSYTPLQFLFDEEDSVAVRLRTLGDFPSGAVYDNEYVFIYRFRGERICEMREFTDVAYIDMLRRKATAGAG
jgi:ketosteroid isomerase-like protein